MISLLLEHLDKLHADLDKIDPAQDIAAADKVADIAAALRRVAAATRDHVTEPAQVGQRGAA